MGEHRTRGDLLRALLTYALSTSQASSYSCKGSTCCDLQCLGPSCAQVNGKSIPLWWQREGWSSCDERVSKHYDPTIPCSEGIRAFQPCGFNEPHACGYGLACVAQSISYSQVPHLYRLLCMHMSRYPHRWCVRVLPPTLTELRFTCPLTLKDCAYAQQRVDLFLTNIRSRGLLRVFFVKAPVGLQFLLSCSVCLSVAAATSKA
jgi:hypothetical protein